MVNGYGNNDFKLTREESVSIAEIIEKFLEECRGADPNIKQDDIFENDIFNELSPPN